MSADANREKLVRQYLWSLERDLLRPFLAAMPRAEDDPDASRFERFFDVLQIMNSVTSWMSDCSNKEELDEVDQLARSAVVDARGFGISDDVLRRVFRGLASKHFQL